VFGGSWSDLLWAKQDKNLENKRKRAMPKERKFIPSISAEKKAKKPVKKVCQAGAGHELDNTPSSAMSGQSSGVSGKSGPDNFGPGPEVNLIFGDGNGRGLGTPGTISPIKMPGKSDLSLWEGEPSALSSPYKKKTKKNKNYRTNDLVRKGTNANRKCMPLPVRWPTRPRRL